MHSNWEVRNHDVIDCLSSLCAYEHFLAHSVKAILGQSVDVKRLAHSILRQTSNTTSNKTVKSKNVFADLNVFLDGSEFGLELFEVAFVEVVF